MPAAHPNVYGVSKERKKQFLVLKNLTLAKIKLEAVVMRGVHRLAPWMDLHLCLLPGPQVPEPHTNCFRALGRQGRLVGICLSH